MEERSSGTINCRSAASVLENDWTLSFLIIPWNSTAWLPEHLHLYSPPHSTNAPLGSPPRLNFRTKYKLFHVTYTLKISIYFTVSFLFNYIEICKHITVLTLILPELSSSYSTEMVCILNSTVNSITLRVKTKY
jgi:hypothetical protein